MFMWRLLVDLAWTPSCSVDAYSTPSGFRPSKTNSQLPDLRQLESKVALWLDSRRRHVWIYSQLATTTAGQGPATGATFTLSVSETFSEGRCHTACEATAGMSYSFRNEKQRNG